MCFWDTPFGVRVQMAPRGKVGGCAASLYKTFTTAPAARGENRQTALTGDGNTPLLPTAPSPEGEVCSPLSLLSHK
jgi:hypothetical protein